MTPSNCLACESQSFYGVARKGTLLFSVPLDVVTSTVPVFPPVGTVVLISLLETTVNVAAVPLVRQMSNLPLCESTVQPAA
jgi:hypothetical protein